MAINLQNKTIPLNRGKPQGSQLSPAFYNFSNEPLLDFIEKKLHFRNHLFSFADDLRELIQHQNQEGGIDIMKKAIKATKQAASKFNQPINLEKSVFTRISGRYSPPYQLEVDGIQFKKESKYLGIIFDSSLTFNTQLYNIK